MDAQNQNHTSGSQITGKTGSYTPPSRSWTPAIKHDFPCTQCPLYQVGIGCQQSRDILIGRETVSCMFVTVMLKGVTIGEKYCDRPYELAVDNLNQGDPQ